MYEQGFGFIQLYMAPFYMALPAVSAILIGGASVNKADVYKRQNQDMADEKELNEEEQEMTVTLTLDDDTEVECVVLTVFRCV